jgi:hypothetical protein
MSPAPGADILARHWTSYERQVLHPAAGESQRMESRRAFMAGAHIVLRCALRIGEYDVTEAEGIEILERLRHEIDAFHRAVGKTT